MDIKVANYKNENNIFSNQIIGKDLNIAIDIAKKYNYEICVSKKDGIEFCM